jgi:hypothetical protein
MRDMNRNKNFDFLRRFLGCGCIANQTGLFSASTESLISLGKRALSDNEAREIELHFELISGWFEINNEIVVGVFKNPFKNDLTLSENSKKLLNDFLKSIQER